MNQPERLQKYLARCGVASRRKAETLIASGQIYVDGQLVTEMGYMIIPGVSKVTYNGKPVKEGAKLFYFLVNKPKGYVTTAADPQGRPIVTSLIKERTPRLFPVGRLDLDTEGALILTNDGELAQKILHPSYNTNKTYEALIRGIPDPNTLATIDRGFLLEQKMTAPAKTSIKAIKGPNCIVKITIHEGRKRQVKKMFAQFGHPVLHLKRTAYGKLVLGSLPVGHYIHLNPSDLKKIFL